MPDSGSQNGSDRVAMRSHAKLNLALAVAPPIREPGPTLGMHPIASWMAPIGLADEVEILRAPESAAGSEYNIAWADGSPVGWAIESDLAVRAYRAMEEAADRPLPVQLTVRKSIPAGGGLGGGSADAAAVLRGVNHLYGLGFDASRLRTIASSLGSDIPFFIPDDPSPASPPGAALVTGLGDTLEPAPVLGLTDDPPGNPLSLTLVFPPFGCPTGGIADEIDGPVHVSGSGSTLFVFGSWADRLRPVLPPECVAAETTVLSSSS